MPPPHRTMVAEVVLEGFVVLAVARNVVAPVVVIEVVQLGIRMVVPWGIVMIAVAEVVAQSLVELDLIRKIASRDIVVEVAWFGISKVVA